MSGRDPDGDALLEVPSPAALRDELERLVLADLLGPAGGEEEEVAEPQVSDRYCLGILAPRERPLDRADDEELALGGDEIGDDGGTDAQASGPAGLFPSSAGLTFSVAGDARAIRVTARWGRYERADSERIVTDTGRPKEVWKRRAIEGASSHIPLRAGPVDSFAPSPDQPEVVVRGKVRRTGDHWIVSLFLVNGQAELERAKDAAWLFQVGLEVDSPDGAVFVCRRTGRGGARSDAADFADEAELAMIFRRRPEFAVGHGTAVHVETAAGDPWRAVRLVTCAAPTYDVARVAPPTADDPGFEGLRGLVLDMGELAGIERGGFAAALGPLATAYAEWIGRQEAKVADPREDLSAHGAAADRALGRARRTLERIRAGIALLDRDEAAARAFRFANQAMRLQRVHSIHAEARRRGLQSDLAALDASPGNRRWYPFQLGFILISLPALVDLHHADRGDDPDAVADLLWFPTGGGKTEAYLGLTAFALAIRRLQGVVAGRSGERGVAVLMRYTLRLLTLQQFQRATALVCACESIRRDALAAGDRALGEEPFRVGLWVGQRATPNTTEASAEAVEVDHGRFTGTRTGTPAQLTSCPWCGAEIVAGRDIVVERFEVGRGRTLTFCGDPLGACLFGRRLSPGEGLPVVVVDEEIYRLLPALVIATVDKFAQLPWTGETQMLFGRVSGFCPRHGFRSAELRDSDSHPRRGSLPAVRTIAHGDLRPPDLIVQDELHLIGGPLGTLVGLYETAVDALATWEVAGRRVRPKVVASTATIRNSATQVQALFLRRVEVFPPTGLDAEDNFFAVERRSGETSRRYLGICAPGRRLKSVLIRVYTAFLAAGGRLYEKYGAAADPWMTLVGYFSSLRELGGMRRLVDDDVRSRLAGTGRRGLAARRIGEPEELTSRKASIDIPATLDRLEVGFDPAADERRREARRQGRAAERSPIDVLLATSMISVGVDVKRLGLMVTCGQPKTTAEFIQATSRVGRQTPGIVATVYNWARPRDLSHYERFEHYHATFYEQVEAISLTPFAARALDRGLSALLVALVRLEAGRYNPNEAAALLDPADAIVDRAACVIHDRIEKLSGNAELALAVRGLVAERIDVWTRRARAVAAGMILGYRGRRDGVTLGLLRHPGGRGWDLFACQTSLREVEPQAGLILVDDGLTAPLAAPVEIPDDVA